MTEVEKGHDSGAAKIGVAKGQDMGVGKMRDKRSEMQNNTGRINRLGNGW